MTCGWKILVGEVAADVVETARALESEVESEDGTGLLQSHDQPWTDGELLLVGERRNWALEIESTPHKDAVRIVDNKGFKILYKLNW